MNPTHPDSDIQAMIDERPMRDDLAKMPLSPNPDEARDQLMMRQSVPKPLSEQIPIIRNICAWIGLALEKRNPR